MLHFLPDAGSAAPTGAPYAEAVARLASIQQALRVVELMEGKPARPASEIGFERLPPLGGAAWRCLEERSAGTVGAAAAGIELILGSEPNPAAVEVLAEDIRAGLEDIERLFAGRA